jgi:hypothetical protein
MVPIVKPIVTFVLGALIAFAASTVEAKPVRTKGYVTKSGTYVPPHYRTAPNRTKVDNYTSRPNVNPYTGKTGTRDPYKVTTPKRKKRSY